MRTAEDILRDIAKFYFDGIVWDTKLRDDLYAWSQANPPRPPDVTTIRGDGNTIVIAEPDDETTINPEHPACYLIFEDGSIVKAFHRDDDRSDDRWYFSLKCAGKANCPVENRKIFHHAYLSWELKDTPFKQHTACGKSAEKLAGSFMLGLPCLAQPCCACGSDPRSLHEKMEQGGTVASTIHLGQRPGLDDGNHRDQTEEHLNAAQEEFARESGWLGVSTGNRLEELIIDDLMERHQATIRRAESRGRETGPSLTSIVALLDADDSIPLGWAFDADVETIAIARSALAMARIALFLNAQEIIGKECRHKLLEPWSRISPGRSRFANKQGEPR